MMKKHKFIGLLMIFVLSTSILSGCFLKDMFGREKDDGRTTLVVGVYDGGIGASSLYALKQRFEAKYADYVFEEGKKGVNVKISPSRSYSDLLAETIKDQNVDVFYSTSANSKYLGKKNLVLDIADVYNTSLQYDFVTGETDTTIEDIMPKDKVRTDLKDYYKEDGGQYYGFFAPSTFYGIVYDIDLFKERNYFFRPDGSFVTSENDQKSGGPDGNIETEYDNGLPATYEQFFELCNKMISEPKGQEVTPIMWGGTVQEYASSLLIALAADYSGKEQTELNFNYEGIATNLISGFNGNTPIIGKQEMINSKNGYKLYQSAGRYYALKFLEQLISNPKYYNFDDATKNSFSHTDAQDAYLYSKYSTTRNRTAMLIDGNWWQKEASETFDLMVAEKGEKDSAYNRNFGILPLPKATADKVGEPYTVLEYAGGDGFVNANIKEFKIPLAKAFIQFTMMDNSLVEYLEQNFITMPYSMNIGDKYQTLSPWAKSMYNISSNAVIATMYNKSKIFQDYSTSLWYSPVLWQSKIGGTTYTYPTFAMINKNIDAKTYFNGLKEYWSSALWESTFKGV